MAALPKQWNNWVIQNLLKGVPAPSLLKTLLENGFAFPAIKKALGGNLPANLTCREDEAFYTRLAKPEILNNPNLQMLGDDTLQLYRLDAFLNDEECDAIVELSKSKLRRSEISSGTDYDGFRTSSTCDLPYLNEPAVDALDKKIAETLGLQEGRGEVMQAQHYDIGQQFKAHTDYFEPGTDEYKRFCVDGGQRTWTFMIYLNEGCEGGETDFLQAGVKLSPRKGTAILWNNLLPDGSVNYKTLHQSHPVTVGEKVIITKWFRTDPSQ